MDAWNGRNKDAQVEKIRRLQALPNVVIAVGNRILLSGFVHWLGEMDRGSPHVNVHWVHTKFMLADPLSDDPVVVTGSANFSKASTDNNDKFLIEDGDWTADYFTPGDRSAKFARRMYFSGS